MLGTIIGDIVGSTYEFKNFKSKIFSPLFHQNSKYTDDTVCTISVADALCNEVDPVESMQSWCRRYEDNGGWGQRFALWIADDDPKPYGSWGNGGAMRIAPVGLWAQSEDQVLLMADRFTAITHNHPDAIASARAVALAVYWARSGLQTKAIAHELSRRFGYDLTQTPDDIRPSYKRTETAAGSVPQAIICALQSVDFEDALRNAVSIGGDSDTIAAIAGGIAEALHGIPADIAATGWGYLPTEMRAVLKKLYSIYGSQNNPSSTSV